MGLARGYYIHQMIDYVCRTPLSFRLLKCVAYPVNVSPWTLMFPVLIFRLLTVLAKLSFASYQLRSIPLRWCQICSLCSTGLHFLHMLANACVLWVVRVVLIFCGNFLVNGDGCFLYMCQRSYMFVQASDVCVFSLAVV